MSGDSQLPITQAPGDLMPLAFAYTHMHIHIPSYIHTIKKQNTSFLKVHASSRLLKKSGIKHKTTYVSQGWFTNAGLLWRIQAPYHADLCLILVCEMSHHIYMKVGRKRKKRVSATFLFQRSNKSFLNSLL